ncbi:dTDP-4-dehydrorhamnose reductase [Roseibium polysiphoniae]|uniref:dTDP-4-dehydrorhamnose reductase n=1 Tax=Roseibium polysiphoniae TaxID=2571221 RepID=A0A944CHP5_9HYPH|nr:dTDP-4-dehydrorhamnose reductase [Roseibium polysiphoniae]MBS8262787.1 dTDP-4-dehydrorhamnose reductase [Roseibium polysiphoniae]
MKILVTGQQGQVARCLADRAADHPELELVFAARKGTAVFLDLTDEASIRAAVKVVQPDIIINAAAYTAVDQAEDEPDLAMQINGIAPGILADAAESLRARIIQISTDYVFDGELDRPYRPDDLVNPIGVYGKTKLAGEEAVRAATPNHVIVRTAWIYSPYGKNFYKTMLRLAESRDEVSVVDDQIGNPTSAYEIADGLLAICDDWANGGRSHLGETIHLVGPEEMTWCGFARKVFAESVVDGGSNCHVNAITTEDFPTKAKRPKNSRLASVKLQHF